ncbi:MAG: hypothetical protein QOG72_2662 [Sphingomonadales bacterium]|nr:hypothetical protein [Sphingomonadales bacterium]
MTGNEWKETLAAELEAAPHIPYVDWSGEIAIATLRVLTRRLGPDFAQDVRSELSAKALRWRTSGDDGDQQDAPLLEELVAHSLWEELTTGSQ